MFICEFNRKKRCTEEEAEVEVETGYIAQGAGHRGRDGRV